MDRVYRIFQKGEDAASGEVVTGITIKSIITQPLKDEQVPAGLIPIRGAAYAGEDGVKQVEVSIDNGQTWNSARLIGLEAPYAWRHWEYLWDAQRKGVCYHHVTGNQHKRGTAARYGKLECSRLL